MQRKRKEKRREGRRSKEVKKGEESPSSEIHLWHPQDCQSVAWNAPNTIHPRTTVVDCHPRWKKPSGTACQIREPATRAFFIATIWPDQVIFDQTHLQHTPTTANYGTKPRSTVKEVTSCQETAQKMPARAAKQKSAEKQPILGPTFDHPDHLQPH